MDSINKLIELFSEFPGIGPRQAKRFVYYLLRHNNGFLNDLSENISNLKKEIGTCSTCFQFFQRTLPKQTLCSICADSHRDQSELIIVSHDVDLEHIEKLDSRTSSLLNYIIVIGDRVVGNWKRTLKKSSVVIESTLFAPLTAAEMDAFAISAQRYGEFLGLPVVINP